MYNQGLVWIITGNGKGKTTAAMGQVVRALGHNLKVAVIQFLKGDPLYGEYQLWQQWPQNNLFFRQVGRNEFVNPHNPAAIDREMAQQGWRLAQACLAGQYDLVILDELSVAVDYNLLPEGEVVQALGKRPAHVTVVITGRNAPESFRRLADTVSVVGEEKHHYAAGIQAQVGLEF